MAITSKRGLLPKILGYGEPAPLFLGDMPADRHFGDHGLMGVVRKIYPGSDVILRLRSDDCQAARALATVFYFSLMAHHTKLHIVPNYSDGSKKKK